MLTIKKYFTAILLSASIFSGCSVWENFTTYFNVYYNTSELFDEAEEEILLQKANLFSIDDTQIPSSANQKLVKVVEKASKILQFHQNSSFFDDALMMLGKSFFYQQNYQKGLRKFQELMALQEENDLVLETKLWIAKSHRQLKNYDEFLSTLSEVKKQAKDEDEEDILAEAYIQEVKYYLTTENYDNAIEVINEFFAVSDDDVLKAEALYQLGLLYIETDELNLAAESFKNINKFSPTYEIEFLSRLELAKVYRESSDYNLSLDVLDDMASEDKYEEYFPQIEFETGLTLTNSGRHTDAINKLVSVDTAYSSSTSAGLARFYLGKILEEKFSDYDSALSYYSKTIGGQLPADIIIESNQKVTLLKKYFYLRSLIEKNEEKRFYILNPDEFVKDSIAYNDSLKAYAEQQEIAQLQDEMRNQLENDPNQNIEEQSGKEGETGDQPRGRGRGRGEINTAANTAPASGNTNQQFQNQEPPARPTISEDSVNVLLGKSYYDLGNLFFTEMNVLDSAEYYYLKALEIPDNKIRPEIIFALGSYYEVKGDEPKSDSLFSYIYENFRDRKIVNAAAAKLNKELVDLEYDPAKEIYIEAEKEMLQKAYSSSAKKFYNIFKEYPASPLAPQALFASGWILENELNLLDSAAVIYDSILIKYPQTVYAGKIRPKISYYKDERERSRLAVEDSLREIRDRRLADSIAQFEDISQALEDSAKVEINIENREFPKPDSTYMGIIPNPDSLGVNDSLYLLHQKSIDSLRRNDRIGLDTLQRELNRGIDSLNPGTPAAPPGGNKK